MALKLEIEAVAAVGRDGSVRRSATPEVIQAIVEDIEDLASARKPPEPPSQAQAGWKKLGPGLVAGIANNDPSAIGAYSVAGARFGYSLLWLNLFTLPLLVAVQEMCGRIAVMTGDGLARVIRQHYPRWVLIGAVALLFGANLTTIWADLDIISATAAMLFGLPQKFWLTGVTLLTTGALVLLPYKVYARGLKWLSLALGAYAAVAFLPATHIHWRGAIEASVIPEWQQNSSFVLTVVAFLGCAISPYIFFWQAGETVEEQVAEGATLVPGHRLLCVTEKEIRSVQEGTIVGMTFSRVIAFFVVVSAAATLHAHGITNLNTAQDAARSLAPLGHWAYLLFTLEIVGSGLLALPTLAGSVAYAVSEGLGWNYGLFRRFRRASRFYLCLTGMILLGYALNWLNLVSPVKALLYASVLNGLAAPPLIALLLLICNNPKIVKRRRNSLLTNTIGWAAVLLMSGVEVMLLRAIALGQIS